MAAPVFDAARADRLRALPLEVLVPGDLPAGFSVRDVEAEDNPDWGASYRVVLEGNEGATIFVEGTTGGVGDVMRGESRQKFHHPAMGEGVIEFYGPDSEEPVHFRSHWLQAGPEGPSYGLAGRNLDPDQALRAAEHLVALAGP